MLWYTSCMKSCKLDECPRAHFAKDYCYMHYKRWRRTGDPGGAAPLRSWSRAEKCGVADCQEQRKSYGYCAKHSSRYVRHGDPEKITDREYKNPPCAEDGCKRRAARRRYCRPHASEHFPRGPRKPLEYGDKDNPYIAVYMPGHPNAWKNGYVPEHVKVMTEVLGRALYLGENVHHKYGVRRDNRPGGLELWVTSQPAGQRPEDLVVWAREILRRYDHGDCPTEEL